MSIIKSNNLIHLLNTYFKMRGKHVPYSKSFTHINTFYKSGFYKMSWKISKNRFTASSETDNNYIGFKNTFATNIPEICVTL